MKEASKQSQRSDRVCLTMNTAAWVLGLWLSAGMQPCLMEQQFEQQKGS